MSSRSRIGESISDKIHIKPHKSTQLITASADSQYAPRSTLPNMKVSSKYRLFVFCCI